MSTKLQETINQHGGNIKPLMDILKAAQKRVLELRDKRDGINAEIAEERAKVKAVGISKKAFDYALNRSQMDPEKRDELDQDCALACDAMGCPITGDQGSLFETKEKGKKKDGASQKSSVGKQQADAISKAA